MRCLSGLFIYCLLLVLTWVSSTQAHAQLSANFVTSTGELGGCSPFSISYINTTTGASAAAVYSWDFGNGNTVTTTNATAPVGASYSIEKVYTVTLTVTDGAQTSTKQLNITVFKKPVVNFSFSIDTGCAPLKVHFNSTSQAGDGTITNYFWDFGDGHTRTGANLDTTSNIYDFAGTNSVHLTVTNSHGCQNTVIRSNIIHVLPTVRPGFTPSTELLCKPGDTVKFTNNTMWVGGLSYTWDFGDTKISNSFHASHSYSTRDSFWVSLTATGAHGCTGKFTYPRPIVVPEYYPHFSFTGALCTGTGVLFTNLTTPKPDSIKWSIGSFTSTEDTINYTFASPITYPVKLTGYFGKCVIDSIQELKVHPPPIVKGFIFIDTSVCGAPTVVQFKDTTPGGIAWLWNFDVTGSGVMSTQKEPTHLYTANNTYSVSLQVTTTNGCSTTIVDNVVVDKPPVFIEHFGSTSPHETKSCEAFTISFRAKPDSIPLVNHKWVFGDGGISTDSAPTHTFSTYGEYWVKLYYTTSLGCYDSVVYGLPIKVYKQPIANFSGSRIWCGNTPVDVKDSSQGPIQEWIWDFNAGQGLQNLGPLPGYKYQDSGTYTIKLIVINGVCADSITKENYITVLPPFPRISRNIINTCNGTRGLVTFKDSTTHAQSWSWDFGDSSAIQTYTSLQNPVIHEYMKTGVYMVKVTAVNGPCTVQDSARAYVLLKQTPQLSITPQEVCVRDSIQLTVSGLEINPHTINSGADGYFLRFIQYGDFSGYSWAQDDISGSGDVWDTAFTFWLKHLKAGKENMRIVQVSGVFNCTDTTNFAVVKIKGPIPGFSINNKELCIGEPVQIVDTSKGTFNVPLVKWEWDFGDSSFQTLNTGGSVSHLYENPSRFGITLKVTDSLGCWDNVSDSGWSVVIKGPKADFNWTPPFVEPGVTTTFQNSTNTFNAGFVDYKWRFSYGNSTTTQATNIQRVYPAAGVDTVTLIAHSSSANCSDTIRKIIPIKTVHAYFDVTTQYINNNSCPPLVGYFQSHSTNAVQLIWHFGDGGVAQNNPAPSHTYLKPGVYTITLYAISANNVVDSMKRSIEVKGPFAVLKSTISKACAPATVTLYAESSSIKAYTWDFGDGTLINGLDTFATHTYKNPGVFRPALIMKESANCSATFELPERILIDSLHISFTTGTKLVCDSGQVQFTPTTKNVGADSMMLPLVYHWSFGTGNNADTSNQIAPIFGYNQLGKYAVKLTVQSAAGCIKQVTDTVVVNPRSKGTITAPVKGCDNVLVSFTAAPSVSGNVSWFWTFNNGNSSNLQNPPSQSFIAGNYNVQLVTERLGCYDTTIHPIAIYAKPDIDAGPAEPVICKGQSVQLIANDAVVYKWTPIVGLSNANIANPVASPKTDTRYYVDATNQHGCKNRDSLKVIVVQPSTVRLKPDTFVCVNSSIQLSASGTDKYQWITGVATLSNVTIRNPVATPLVNTIYTVVGGDNNNCFTDTATIRVLVKPIPKVDAGKNQVVLTGSTVDIKTITTNDVVAWQWSPPTYLNCSSCEAVKSTPKSDITYIVDVTSKWGCKASDTVSLKLKCNEAAVHIPTGFTPNNDNRNEVFYPLGGGIKVVKEFRVYDRWGVTVFERKDFELNCQSCGWNGTYKGQPSPIGAYVWSATMICDTGEEFSLKGTVTLIR